MAFMPLEHRAIDAGRKGDISLMRKLFKNMIKTDVTDDDGNTALTMAAKYDHVAAAKLLIDYGFNINHLNNHRFQPIHYAAINGSSRMLLMLLENGAQYDCCSKEGLYPIQFTSAGTLAHKILYKMQKGTLIPRYEEISDVPLIPDYSIPKPKPPKDKSAKGKKGSKKGKKGGKKKR